MIILNTKENLNANRFESAEQGEYEENYDGWAYGVEVFPKEITKTIYVRELDKQE